MNIVTVTVSTAVMGMVMPGVMLMSISPTVASVRANNFAVAETAAVTYSALAHGKYELPETPEGCTTENQQDNTFTVTCTHGEGKYKSIVSRAFALMDDAGTGLGIYSDDDRDGFDDVTGLPTHYFECYSGWKGNGTVKNNCDLGGKYVIPAYAFLYN